MSRAVYYTSDDDRSCVYRLRRSLDSLRNFNKRIPVYVAFSGVLQEEDRHFFENHDVTLIYNPEKANPFLARFRILENGFSESELLYLDTDTILFEDVEKIFDQTGPEDFHAREAPLTNREGYPFRIGSLVQFTSIVNYQLYDSIRKALGRDLFPLFNIGVMIFKNDFHNRLVPFLDDWDRLLRLFETFKLPFPCSNPYVSREIVTPLVFAGIPHFSWKFLDPGLAPFYIEYRCNDTGKGIAMHVLNRSYIAYILDFADRNEALRYMLLARPKAKKFKVKRLRNKLMPLAGYRHYRKFPAWFMRAWVQFGVWIYRRKSRMMPQPEDHTIHDPEPSELVADLKRKQPIL